MTFSEDDVERPVSHEGGTQPDSNPKVMVALEEVGVLDAATTERMTQAARFRNVLAHTFSPIVQQI